MSTPIEQPGLPDARPAETIRVTGMTGPLADGEVVRAQRWGAELAAALVAERHSV